MRCKWKGSRATRVRREDLLRRHERARGRTVQFVLGDGCYTTVDGLRDAIGRPVDLIAPSERVHLSNVDGQPTSRA